MKSLNVKNLFIIIFLFTTANAFSDDTAAEKLYNWLNKESKVKTIEIKNLYKDTYMKTKSGKTDVNDPVELYQKFDYTITSDVEFETKHQEKPTPDGFYLPDMKNRCTWMQADKSNIIISGRFTGCTFGWYKDDKGHLYTAHIFNEKGTTDQNIEAKNFLKDSNAPKGTTVHGFRTAGLLKASGNALFGYVIGTFVKGEWKWKWVTISSKDQKTIVSCSDITQWDTFPLDDSLK